MCILDPALRSARVLIQEQPVAPTERLPGGLDFAPRHMASIVGLGCDPRIWIEEDQLRPTELNEMLAEFFGVVCATSVREWPVDDRDVESGEPSETLNLVQVAEVPPGGGRNGRRDVAYFEQRRGTVLEVCDLNEALNPLLSREVQQRRPLHEIAIVAVPRIPQAHPLPLSIGGTDLQLRPVSPPSPPEHPRLTPEGYQIAIGKRC